MNRTDLWSCLTASVGIRDVRFRILRQHVRCWKNKKNRAFQYEVTL
jgi:hypothetical protein